MDVVLPLVIVVGSAVAGYIVRKIGPVVLGAVVTFAVLGVVSLATIGGDLHLEGLGVLFVLTFVAVLSAIGAVAGVALRGRRARSAV